MDRSHRIKAVFTDSPSPPQINYTLTVEAAEGLGTLDPIAGNYVYHSIVTVPISASPEAGWEFHHWEIDGENFSENPLTVTMNKDHDVKAVFIESQQISIHTLTIESPTGNGLTDPDAGSYIHFQEDNVLITATPDPDWVLDHWLLDGLNVGSDNPLTISMDSDHDVKPVFIQEETDSGNSIPGFPFISILLGLYIYYRARARTNRSRRSIF